MRKMTGIKNKIKTNPGRTAFVVINTILMIFFSMLFLFPYLNVVAKAFNEASDTALGGLTIYPRKFTLDYLELVLKDSSIITGFKITILRVVIGSLWALAVQYLAAYALAQKKLSGRGFVVLLLTLPMFINGGLVSRFITYAKLGVYNTFWVYILPSGFSFFNMVVIRTFLQGISETYAEAARLDGASEFRIVWSVYVPLSMPIIATILLWLGVERWNDYTTTLYFVQNPSLYTLPYVLQVSLKETETVQKMIQDAIQNGLVVGGDVSSNTADSVNAAQLVVSTIPLLLLYPFLQKYFTKGISLGGIKE